MSAVAWTVLLALFMIVSVWAVTVTGLLFYSAPDDEEVCDEKNAKGNPEPYIIEDQTEPMIYNLEEEDDKDAVDFSDEDLSFE